MISEEQIGLIVTDLERIIAWCARRCCTQRRVVDHPRHMPGCRAIYQFNAAREKFERQRFR